MKGESGGEAGGFQRTAHDTPDSSAYDRPSASGSLSTHDSSQLAKDPKLAKEHVDVHHGDGADAAIPTDPVQVDKPVTKLAWVHVIPAGVCTSSIFDFAQTPVEVLPATAVATSTPETLQVPPEPVRKGVHVVSDDHDQDRPSPRPTATLSDCLETQITIAHQDEKAYVTPQDIPEFGWRHVFCLGGSLTYITLLLRRNISPRFLEVSYDKNASLLWLHHSSFSTACFLLANAGLAFNESTEELIVRSPNIHEPPTPLKRAKQQKHKVRPRHRKKQTHDLHEHQEVVQGLGTTGAIAIFRALRVNKCLRSLILEDAGIGDVAMCALAAMIRTNRSLTSLSLKGNLIGPQGAQALCEALEDSPDSMLLRLDLSWNRISDEGVTSICRVLEENETLFSLGLAWNRLSADAVCRMLLSLRQNFVLHDLSVFGKDLDEDQYCLNLQSKHAQNISLGILRANPSFASITLSSERAVIPIEKVRDSRWLSLADCKLVELDALVLAGLLPSNDKLITLDLSNNPAIERWGVLEVLKSVQHCKTLQSLRLANTGLFEEVGADVGDLIAANSTLQVVTMHEINLHVQQIRGGAAAAETMEFDTAALHFLDRWILAKCLVLNRPTQCLNSLRLPLRAASDRDNGVSWNISGRKLALYEAVFVATKVLHDLSIHRLAINGCGLDAHGGAAIADGVRNHRSLRVLEIENNALSVAGGLAMAECIQFNASLTFVNLSWNRIGNDGARTFAAALSANKTIRRLDLRGNALSAAGILAISAGLKKNVCLEELFLRWNPICSTSGKALAEALEVNKTLRVLDIEHHIMGSKGGHAFAVMLIKNDHLRELNLKADDAVSDGAANGIGTEAAKAIAAALSKSNRTLTSLSVGQNQIGSDGMEAYAALLKFTSTLQVVDLSLSSMDGKLAKRFFECLALNHSIRKLNLEHNGFSNEGMMACAHALEVNTTLCDLNIAHNSITEEPLAYWANKLRVQPPAALQWVCLIGNTMTEATQRAFRKLAPRISVELEQQRHHQEEPPKHS